ncbi:MAG: hypothetical protein ACOCX2_02805 [Armatimonadota bacterium]
MWRTTITVIVVAATIAAGTATAQTGTWDIPSATTVDDAQTRVFTDVRLFEEDNETWGVFVRGGFDDNGEATFGYFDWDVTGEDPINGAVRRSNMSGLVADIKWLLRDRSPRIAVRGGADLPVGDATGANTETGGTAFMRGAVPTVSVPIEFGDPDGILWILEPKVVWFDTLMPSNVGPPVDSFGTTVMIGGGVRYPVGGNLTFVADAAYPVDGSNTIDDATNTVTEELAWSAGVSAELGSGWDAGVFATTAAGPTPATSSIAAPDQSIGLGVNLGKAW